MLPDYLAKAVPNPMGKRGPWYANTAPSYAGIFLWVAFYKSMPGETLKHGGLGLCLAALLIAALLCHALYYRVPAMLGMQTGYPLYVVGSSTFGTAGGYIMPGLLMGLLQIGWFAVATFVVTDFILKGLGVKAGLGTAPFIITGAIVESCRSPVASHGPRPAPAATVACFVDGAWGMGFAGALPLLSFEFPQPLIHVFDPVEQVGRGHVGALRPLRQLGNRPCSSVDQSANTIHTGVHLRHLRLDLAYLPADFGESLAHLSFQGAEQVLDELHVCRGHSLGPLPFPPRFRNDFSNASSSSCRWR